LAIHICWKVDRLARMEPPIQTEYLRSCKQDKPEAQHQQWSATQLPHNLNSPTMLMHGHLH
jgi:hypothetical protein